MKKLLLGASAALLLSLMLITPALGWTITKADKSKTLSDAGEVTFTSAFRAADGETITITITPADSSVTIRPTNPVVLYKVTPKPNSASTTNCSISPSVMSAHTVDVTLNNPDACRTGKSTFHLWLYLSTGEHLGVNVAFGR